MPLRHFEEYRAGKRSQNVELSPSPEQPKLTSTADPTRLTTVIPHTRSITSPDNRAACEGDIYVVNTINGERFHLTVVLQGPFHPLTTVTHASLHRTVRNILLSSSNPEKGSSDAQQEPPPTLLLEGMPLDESNTEMLPNNAVIVVHRGVSVADARAQQQQHHRSRIPSQSADGDIAVVEMLSGSLPNSVTAPSEREMSLHSPRRRPNAHELTAFQEERPLMAASNRRSKSSRVARAATVNAATAKQITTSTRLPPRRAAGVAAGGGSGNNSVRCANGATTLSDKATVRASFASAESAPSPSSTFERSNPEEGRTSVCTVTAVNRPSVTFSRTADKTSFSSSPSLPAEANNTNTLNNNVGSLLSSLSDEEAHARRTPSVDISAKPHDTVHDTGISAVTVSAPSSIASMPNLQSANYTQAPADGDYTVERTPSPPAKNSASSSSPDLWKPATTGTITFMSAASSASSKMNNNGNVNVSFSVKSVGEWYRSKPPPVTVLLASSPPPGSSSRPSTAFTPPAFSQKLPFSAHLPAPPQRPQEQHKQMERKDGVAEENIKTVRGTFASDAASDTQERLVSTAAAVTTSSLSVPMHCVAPTATRPATAGTSSALFSTRTRTPTPLQTPDTPRRAVRAETETTSMTGFTTTTTACDDTAQSTVLTTTAINTTAIDTTTTLTPPLPPHDVSSPTESRLQRLRWQADARQAAYGTQRDIIVNAAAAEQQRLLMRLQQHCQTLEAEKKALLATRLLELRAQEAASRLRVLRAAQEDAAAQEIDAVRARLCGLRDVMLDRWLRVLHAHSDQHYAMSHELLQELEAEGERLSLRCVATIAGYHTQRARLQALQQQRVLKEAEVARLRWEAHVRHCATEEKRGCLRVVARVRPPLRRAWLPDWVLSSPEAADFDRGYAVRAVQVNNASATKASMGTTAPPSPSTCIEVVDPLRELRRQYHFAAVYDDTPTATGRNGANTQQRLFKEQLQPLLEHMCRTGQRVAVLAFGTVGSGKSYTLLGPPAEPLPPPPLRSKQKESKKVKTAADGKAVAKAGSGESISFAIDEDDDTSDYDDDNECNNAVGRVSGDGLSKSRNESTAATPTGAMKTSPQFHGITKVGVPPRRGITSCLDPAEEETEMRVLHSLAVAEEAEREQRSNERRAREEHRWRSAAGIDHEDGLLPRAVAWLTAHLRANTKKATTHKSGGGYGGSDGAAAVGEPVVESVIFSMYEVYNDRIYDLLPTPPSTASAPPSAVAEEGEKGDDEEYARRRVRSDPSTWPRWDSGWLPAPHIKNSNPDNLTELQLELVPTRHGSREAVATFSQLQQPTAQPQWRVRASEVEVRSATDVLQAIQLGLQRRRSASTSRSAQSSRSHLFLRFRIEVERPAIPEKTLSVAAKAASPPPAFLFASEAAQRALPDNSGAAAAADPNNVNGPRQDVLRPKGYSFLRAALLSDSAAPPLPSTTSSKAVTPTATTAAGAAVAPTCVTELLFMDFAGSERVELGSTAGDTLKETQYINASLSAVTDVLTALARADPCRDGSGGMNSSSGKNATCNTEAVATVASTLVDRWGALVSRSGVSLSRTTPVFLQPRFTKVPTDGRFPTPSSVAATAAAVGGDRNGERGLSLRRRVLALMDTCVAGQGAAQWWRSWRASSTYIPFRTCKTTQLLQSTMGAPCKTLVLACVHPCSMAEVVLPASMQGQKGKRARELAQALFDHQAPIMLAEVQSTLTFADRVNAAAHEQSDGSTARA